MRRTSSVNVIVGFVTLQLEEGIILYTPCLKRDRTGCRVDFSGLLLVWAVFQQGYDVVK